MTDIRTAVVIGGGIAGPVTAIALQQAGIEATVYEAYDTGSDGVGGMLALAPNGLDALAAVGLDHVVRGLAQPVSAMVIHSWTGKPLARFADPPARRSCTSSGEPTSTGRCTRRPGAVASGSSMATGSSGPTTPATASAPGSPTARSRAPTS
jgi:2-polyprenyl-6-methoxyphenol hydroxylase-like FAD-dependent oxidoreductase